MLELLCQGLRDSGHTAMPSSDGDSGLDLAVRFEFDAMILDIGLPVRDGYGVLSRLRELKKSLPILMLTARDAEDDIIRGLDLGADDYLTKPFSFRELLARLQSFTRIEGRSDLKSDWALDPVRLTARREGQTIQLTRSEFLLLSSLIARRGAPATRKELFETVWGRDHKATPNTLEVLVNSVRNKLVTPETHSRLLTVRGVGYCLQTGGSDRHSEAPLNCIEETQ